MRENCQGRRHQRRSQVHSQGHRQTAATQQQQQHQLCSYQTRTCWAVLYYSLLLLRCCSCCSCFTLPRTTHARTHAWTIVPPPTTTTTGTTARTAARTTTQRAATTSVVTTTLQQRKRVGGVSGGALDAAAAASSTTAAEAVHPEGGLQPCKIRVVGVGGGGCNAVDRMMEAPVDGIEYWALNTDAQSLSTSTAAYKLNLGSSTTKGLGAGGDPKIGQLAAEESLSHLPVSDTDLVFIAAGMGGGTGSGAAPVVATAARKAGALVVAIVTKPFGFEGHRRMQQAEDAIRKLRDASDTVIVVSNNKLLEIIPEDTPLTSAFKVADAILNQAIVGISEIIVRPGLINVDFADIRAVMKDAGSALMGIGTGTGKNGAEDAAIAAISSPLLDEPLQRAAGVVFNIMGPQSMTLQQINRAASVIYDSIDEDANVIFGALVDDELEDEVVITVLATGIRGE